MNRPIVYVDCETTGLDPTRHEVWEVAWAVDNGPVCTALLFHQGLTADPDALALNGYADRWDLYATDLHADDALHTALTGATLAGANPAFDAAFLAARWGAAPWHHRLLDVEAYAAGALGWTGPRGLNDTADALRAKGYDITVPDHSAAADVAAARDAHRAAHDLTGATDQ